MIKRSSMVVLRSTLSFSRKELSRGEVWDYVKQFKENNKKINDVCKLISEKHLIKIHKKHIYRDHEFKDVQERHREQAFLHKLFRGSQLFLSLRN